MTFPPPPARRRPDQRRPGRGIAAARLRRRRVQVVLIAALLMALMPIVGLAGAAQRIADDAVASVRRLPNALPTGAGVTRPTRPTTGAAATALNFLLIGSDSREEEPDGVNPVRSGAADSGRTDTIMMIHLPEDRRSAQVVSFPRDTWVDIPGHGKSKLNAAHAWGGTPLLVQTLEQLTKVRIDHVAVVDFAGFVQITEALGGIPVPTESGVQWISGVAALNFVRERRNLPRGDFDRVQRQQAFLRALMGKVLSTGTFTNPARFTQILTTVANAVHVDDGLGDAQLRDLALSFHNLEGDKVTFFTVPILGTARVEGLSVVRLDEEANARLWPAFREGRAAALVAEENADKLGAVVEDPIKRRRKRSTPSPSASPTTSSSTRSSAAASGNASPTTSPTPSGTDEPSEEETSGTSRPSSRSTSRPRSTSSG